MEGPPGAHVGAFSLSQTNPSQGLSSDFGVPCGGLWGGCAAELTNCAVRGCAINSDAWEEALVILRLVHAPALKSTIVYKKLLCGTSLSFSGTRSRLNGLRC